MTEDSHGGTSADETCFEAWAEFEGLLAAYLSTMRDEDDRLIVEIAARDESGCSPYAQFAGFGDAPMVHGEVSSNAYLSDAFQLDEGDMMLLADAGFELADQLDTPANWGSAERLDEAAAVASRIVFALRHVFGIAHPHLLTYQAWGPAAESVDSLGLWPSDEVPVEVVPVDEIPAPADPDYVRRLKTAYKPKTRQKLVELVGRVLEQKYDGQVDVDDDGDYVLHHMGQPVWVCVRGDQPAVEIMALVAQGVRSRRATLVETGLLNRDQAWVKWELRDRAVWQRLLIPGFPFVPIHLEGMLDVFLSAMTSTRDDLALRVGGRTA